MFSIYKIYFYYYKNILLKLDIFLYVHSNKNITMFFILINPI